MRAFAQHLAWGKPTKARKLHVPAEKFCMKVDTSYILSSKSTQIDMDDMQFPLFAEHLPIFSHKELGAMELSC